MKEEALRRWIGEQVARMEDLKESLDQKRRELARQAPVGEKKGSAEEGQRYGAQEEWKQEEGRRLRQQARRDQDKRAHEQGRGEGRNRISSPTGAPLRASATTTSKLSNGKPPARAVHGVGRKVKTELNAASSQDCSGSSGDEELRRVLELSRLEVEGAGGRHGEELEEDDPDLASAMAASLEEPLTQPSGSLVTSARRSSEDDLQKARRSSLLESGSEQEQKDQ